MKLKELRTRKYVALIMMIVIIGAIVGILKIGNMDFDKEKVKVSKAVINNVTSSLSANVNEATVDNLITSKGYDEIDYVIKYSLSTDENIKERNVIIEASLDDNEKYASFKDVTNGDVISTVSENRKNIKITVKNAKVNKENEFKLVMKLEGAPNGYKVTPKIKIKEVSEEKYTNLNVQNVEVKNNSLTGNVQDEQSMNVSNIELALKKDGEIIKKTYTDENGNYVFSDIEEGEYNLEIDEDIYEKVSEEKVNISGSSKLNIVVKEVTPYKIELKKQITEMTIVNGGKTTTYKYGNLDKVQQALRNVKNMTGEVKYKITVQNTGKKSGIVTVVKDEVPEGLTFNKEKNTSWEEKNGVLYNRSLEGITLNAGEKREEGLTLDIESTSEAKTYINKVTAKGEIYENIVYILDGKTYKEDTVLEGEKIKEPKVDNKNFKGWYTDKKYTNKYNFNNEVTKDLVLYGQTEDIKEYTVTYVDNEKIVKTEKVKENGSLNAPKVSKEGYTFKYWSEEPNGKEYDLSTKVTKDITLYSVYEINKYTVTFINEKEKYDEQEIEYGENIKVPTSPSKEYYTFKYWSLEENGDSYDLSTKVTKDITLYSVYDINKYRVTFIDKGKEIDKQELEAGSLVIAPKVSMEGYTFKYWSKKENGKEYNLNLPITRNLTLYSVYEINKYNVEFYDSNKLIKTIKVDYDNTINSNEVPTVIKTGYTFTGWIENNKNFDFTTKIKENKKLYSKYEIIKNAVIFNDENRITTKKVDYNNKVEKIESQGKIGYTFKYWSTTQDGEEFDFNTLITEGITLYAVYDINEYSVNFIDQGNAYGDTQKVKYNKIAVKPETDPIKEGYTFKYWSLDENGVAYDFNTKITKDTTLYSVYSVNSYKVSFVDNGTKYIEDETIEYNKVAVKPETDPSKEGHTFKYWSLEENGVAYDFNAKITKDITLYSVYSVNNYKVSFIDNGTKYIEDETIEYNKAAIKPETDPSKVGHTFKYWSLGENGTAYDFSTKITKDTTLYSVYEANEYTVKFMDGDNLFKQEQVKYGLKATKPSENPTKEHNLFKTWTLNDKEYDFNLPVIDNMILRSSYEEIEKPSISHVPTEWTNNKVTVTITSSHEDYKYLYKIDTGEYKEYTGPFDIDYNCTVVAKSVKENVDSITELHDITNIDKIKPIINSLNETNVSGTSFDINVSTIDNESGMKQIHIYKDDLLETTIVYNENYNEEKNSTYTFNDLVSGKDYKIKVIAEDVAGNLSEAKEITVKTEEKIVARIIGRENKLFEDENLYENFSSLERAIKACPSNQCTIEMVTDTKESVEVLEGQDITLNINGKTITGVKDTYTINNGGNLIIKDNAEEAGSIVNNAGVALKNETTGVLTLGELEDELVVSTTKPYINGGTFGIVNEYIDKNTKGRFNFYDGMIAGNIAIEGEVNDKPYLYNASVVTSDNRQVATLKILEDAEARIVRTGVYYTKIDKAVEDTNSGTLSEPTTTNTNLMQGFSNVDDTGFTYDSETNTLSSEPGKSVKAYTVIDLTGYENDQYLFISSDVIDTYYGNFEVIVRENDAYGNNISQTKTTDDTTKRDNYKFYLTKGKKYYVRLDYTTYSQNETNMVTIYDMFLQKINKYVVDENTVLETVSNSYGFEYDKTTRTLKSNNQYQNGTTAFSYIEVDLTNEDEDKEVIINASLDTLYSCNYGNIVISENNEKLSSASYGALGYLYANDSSRPRVGKYNYSKVLTKGKKYYIQFYYFKDSYDNYSEDYYKTHDSKDQFTINTIDIVGLGDKQDIDLSTNLKTNYYGINSYDSSYDRYSISSYAPYGEKFDSYVKVDLTKSKTDQMIDLNLILNSYSSIYITSNNKDSDKELVINNMDNTLLSFNSYNNYYINGNSNYYDFRDYKYVLPKGSVYYVHFASFYPGGKPNPYIKNISLVPVTDNMINIGTLSHLKGTIDDSNKPADTNLPYVENDGTTDSNFRFVGNNTKNYVKFNNELWRVIGIFNTTDVDGNYAKRIKLIRDKSLYQDLNIYLSWDSSDSSINNGTGINEWSQADLMKLLNEGYENNAPNNIYSEDTKCKKGEKENPDLPKYIVDDTIYFDPVKYRICDSESDSCPAWTVMSGNNCTGEYELVYKKSDVYDYSKAVESNGGSYDNVLINYLNKISETWSDKIISPSSESNMNSLFDFTKSKARILNTKELSENNLSQKLSICVSSYIASSPCNYPILVMGESSYYNLAYKKVLNYNFPFSNSNNSYSINPVIKIDLNKVENKSDFIGKEKANNLKLNNSLYWTGKSGYCFIGAGEYNKQCDFSSIGLSNSAKSMIDSVVWNTGALPNDYNTRNNLTALEVYAMERGNNTGKTNMDTTSTDYDNVNRTTTWIGKVGLPYVSDYILSSGNGSSYTRDECIKGNSSKYANCVSYNSWLNSTNTDGNSLTITPTYGGEYPSNVASIYTSIYSYPAYSSSTIKPTVYLSPKVKITSGSGTQDDPFIIELGEEENTTLYYGLVPDLIKDDVEDEETEINDEDETLDYIYVKNEPAYGFTYDSEKGVFTNKNKGIANTTAVSYMKIDLTNAASDMPIDINYNISKNDNYSMGFINLMKNSLTKINYNNSSSYSKDSLLVTSNKSSSGRISKVLEKGNIYYLQFAYEKDGNLPVSDTNADSFEIGITYLNDDDKTNDYIRYDGVTTTLNKEADTVQLIKDLNISNSLQIESTKSVELDLNGHTLTTTSSDPVITNNGSLKVTDSKYVPTYANRIEDFNSQISDFKTVKYDTSDFSIFCNNSTSTKKCSYNSFSYGNISISSKETYMNSTFSNYKINFDSKYKSIVGTITLPKASSSFGYVTIGLSSDKNVNESSFDVQKRFVRTSTAAQTFNFELKPTKIGEYYLKICLPRTQISLRINEINSKIDIPTLSDSDYVSSIYSSASSAIKNNEGAYLSVEKTLVYTKDNSTSSSGVDNYGKLSIGNGGYVRAYAYGVNNRETGEIVEGSGTIASTSNYSLYTKSIKKNNIKGYTFVGGSIYNQSNSDLTLDNVIIRDYNYSSAIIDSSIYKLTINNSSIIVPSSTSSYAFKLSEKGMLEINNSNIYGSQAIDNGIKNSYSMGKKDIKINNSYIEGTVSSNTNKKVEINNSTLGDIYNGSSTIDIKDSTINSIDFNSCTLNMDNVIIQSMSLFKNSNSTVTMKNMDMVNTKIENSKNMTIEENVTAMNITNYAGGEFKYNNSKINGILSNRGNANINNTQFADGTIQNLGILTARNTTMTSTKSNLTAVTNEGTLNLNDGFKILNYKKGIYGKGSTINLGSDDETVSSDNIIIDTIDYSIETINESIVNYYDGTLISDNEEVINAPINLVPNGYDVDYSNTNDINKISLNKIIDKDYVAQIGETKYKTLSEAIENVNSDNNQTKIKIIKDIYTVLNSTVDSNKNIELNLDDKKIVYYKKQNPLIVNNGTLKLKTSDSSLEISRVYGESLLENNGTLENNGINLKCYYSNINTFINNGNMNFNSGSIVHNFSGNYKTSKPMRFITNNSKLNVSGGTFSIRNISNDTDNIIYTSSDATTNINDGNFEVGYVAVYSDGITNITGGTFKTSYAIKTSANGNVDVSGGNYSEANNLIYNSGIAKIHDLNSLLKYIGTNDNSIEFTNNVFSTNNYNVFTNNGNSAIFNNNNITSTSMVTSTYGILNFKKGNVIVNGGKYVAACVPFQLTGTANITVTGSNVSSSGNSAIYSTTTGDVNIVSGTYTSADGIAIRNTSENTITFGIKGDTNDDGSLNVSISNPEITGTTAGIKTGSKTVFKFYDGIFTGTTPIDGNVYDTEDEYTVIQVDNSKYLHKDEKETMVARNVDTEKEYSTLQKAIDEATDGNTIQVISEISTLASAEATVVPEGLNVTIDVNGYKINENNALFLSNLGELTITNSNYNETTPSIDDGGIYNTGGSNVIDNSGILKLNKIYIESTVECEMISNKVNGELNIKESILYNSYGKTSSNSVIFNSGTATVDSIKINTSGKSITNNGTINISNSQIRSSDALTNDGILVSENDNITGPITNSSTFTANNITIPSSSTITNTKDFTLNKGTIEYVGLIKNESNMNITGVTITSSSYGCIIKNYGSNSPILNISNSNITSKYYDMADDELHSLDILTGQLILNNTNITRDPRFSNQTTTDSDATEFGLIRTYDAKSVEIIGGIFNFKFGKFLTVINPETTVKVDGATINTYNGIFMQSKHVGNTINLKNVEMKNQKYNILNCNSYYSSVNCGKFSPKFSSYSGGLKLSIEGGNYSGAVDTVILSDYDNITLNNTEIDGNIKGYQSGVSITSSTVNNIVGVSRVTMESGTLSSIYDMYSYTSTPTVIIKSGTVAGSISTMKNQSDMNVTLGIKGDSNVSITDPMISGRITATYLNLYFYDGIVKKNISKPIEVENGYNVKVSTDGYYLVDTPVIKNTTSNKEYNNIRSAVNEISNNDTLQLLDNVWIYTNKIDGGIVNENKNMTFDINGKKIYTPNIPFINNGTVTIIDNASSGKIDYDSPIENNGTMNITSGDFAVTNNGIVNNNGGTVSGTNSSNGTFTQNSGIINSVENSGTINVIDGTVKDLTSNNIANITGGTLNKIINTGQLKIQNATAKGFELYNNGGESIIDTSSGTAYISNNSTLTVSNSTLNSVNSSNRVFNNRYKGTLNITSGNYTSGSTECIYNDEGVLNIGEKGGVISITSPVIQGSKYAVNNAGTFNLYDGKLIGGTAPVSGTITEIEPGYKLSISDDTTNNTKVGYLVVIADDERVAMVNGINFTSLQTAINSVKDNTESNIVIYKDIELTEDIIVPENKIINLYLNGHTITYGDYSFVKNGTLTIIDSAPSESIGASIINTIEKVLNINQNGKNIIVYEMSDGSKLSTENTYNLYKKVDNEYKLLNMEKDEEVGRYITGSNNSEMTSIKGRIYLNNLEEGSYKLVSSDNKDIEFTITEDGKVNGNILENTNEKRKVIESALAYLIITIQTGVNQIKYIIYIVAIVSIILGLYFAFKEQKKLSRKV